MTPDEPPADHHEYMCDFYMAMERRDIMRGLISMPPGYAKALALDTVVPTPTGTTTIADVKIGDNVIGIDGRPTTVIAKSEIFHKPCFKVTTSDGVEVVVSEDHLWTVRLDRKSGKYRTFTTKQLYDRQSAMGNFRAPRLPDVAPVAYVAKDLPIGPYTLGVWLGDGNRCDCTFSCADEDQPQIRRHIEAEGYSTTDRSGKQSFGVKGLALNELNLRQNKHIPDVYFYGSVDQRWALVQGLMDTDGTVNNGTASFCNTDRRLVEGLRRLLWSLGVRNSMSESQNAFGPYWRVNFTHPNAFRLARKVGKLTHAGKYGRYITFEVVDPVPTQCIAVDAPDELFLVTEGFVPTHNTKFFSRFGPAWYLGKNPRHRFMSGGHSQAFVENEFGRYVRDVIADPKYALVFQETALHPRSTAPGNFRLANGRGGYVTKGVGQKIAGYRGHIGGTDDLIGSREDAESPTIRNKVWDWLWADFRQRLLPNSPLYVVATRWHPDDPGGRIEEMNKKGIGIPWEIINLSAVIESEEEMRRDPLGRSIGEVLWPDYYDFNHVMELKATLKTRDWFSLHKGQPRDEEGNVVKAAWFRRYDKLPRNIKDPQGRVVERVVKRITLSVDCANKATQRANYTVITVWHETMDGHHYLAHVIRKKVEYNELIVLIEDCARMWKADLILVEDKGNGTTYIQQRKGKAPAPVIAVTPEDDGSKEFRFDGITPLFEAGMVWLPTQASWLADYEEELLAFPGSTNDDQVDATSQYLSRHIKRVVGGTRKLKGYGHSK